MAILAFLLTLVRILLWSSLHVVRVAAAALKKPSVARRDHMDDEGGLFVLDVDSQEALQEAAEAVRATTADEAHVRELVIAISDDGASAATDLFEWLGSLPNRQQTIERVHARYRLDRPIGGAALGRLLLEQTAEVKDGWIRLTGHKAAAAESADTAGSGGT